MDGREGHPGILPDSRLAGLLQGRAFHQARAPVEGRHLGHPVLVEGLYLRVGPQAGDGQVDGVTVALHAAVEEQGEALGRIMDGTAVTQGQFIGMDAVYQRVPVTDAHALAPQGPQNAYRTALQVAPCLLIAQCQQGLSGPHAVGQGKVEVLEGRHTPERALPAQQVEAVAAAGSGQGGDVLPQAVREGAAKDIAADMAAREGDGIVACAVLSVAAGIDDAADEVIPDAAAADENGVETCIGCPVGRGGTAAGDAGNGAAGDADQVVTGRAVKQT